MLHWENQKFVCDSCVHSVLSRVLVMNYHNLSVFDGHVVCSCLKLCIIHMQRCRPKINSDELKEVVESKPLGFYNFLGFFQKPWVSPEKFFLLQNFARNPLHKFMRLMTFWKLFQPQESVLIFWFSHCFLVSWVVQGEGIQIFSKFAEIDHLISCLYYV